MKYAFSNAQMRAADAAAIAAGTPSRELMERAGMALARRVSEVMQKKGFSDVLFVCGGGNNGGDGFVAARHLQEAGEDVAVLCVAEHFSADCEAARRQYDGECYTRIPRRRYALMVDCLFGTGLTRPIEGENAALVELINSAGYVIACDLPSGLSEGGIAPSVCVRADETVTMGLLKQCLLLADGADRSGTISVAEIGIGALGRGAEVWEGSDVKKFFPPRRSNSHKGSYGAASILAGDTYTGAAFLAAGACLKSGAGYTKLYVPKEMYPFAIGKLPSAVLREFQAIDGELLASDCIAAGMGAGVSERLYVHLEELLRAYTGTLVLDADALNTIAAYGTEVLGKKSCRAILTPHPKEFSRLMGKSVGEILSDPIEAAKRFAAERGVIVVLKNNRTVITDGERVAINRTGSPALAKGGSGDVLSGLLAGTCARGVDAFDAACVSCWLLGKAGEITAERMGEYSPDPLDTIGAIAEAIRTL